MEVDSRLVEAKDGAAAAVLLAVVLLNVGLGFLESILKRGTVSRQEAELAREIKHIVQQANSFSSPATFAKSAKLRRAAVLKEKELAELRQRAKSDANLRSSVLPLLPTLLKASFYALCLWWFWQTPVATIPSQLIQPFDKVISSKKRLQSPDFVAVSVIPWLALCSRVGSFFSKTLRRKRH